MPIEPNKGIGSPIKLFGLSGVLCLIFYGSLLFIVLTIFFISALNFTYAGVLTALTVPIMVYSYNKLKEYEKEKGYNEFMRKFGNKNSIHKHKKY